jgi:Tfp pilus assembly protein PilW
MSALLASAGGQVAGFFGLLLIVGFFYVVSQTSRAKARNKSRAQSRCRFCGSRMKRTLTREAGIRMRAQVCSKCGNSQ